MAQASAAAREQLEEVSQPEVAPTAAIPHHAPTTEIDTYRKQAFISFLRACALCGDRPGHTVHGLFVMGCTGEGVSRALHPSRESLCPKPTSSAAQSAQARRRFSRRGARSSPRHRSSGATRRGLRTNTTTPKVGRKQRRCSRSFRPIRPRSATAQRQLSMLRTRKSLLMRWRRSSSKQTARSSTLRCSKASEAGHAPTRSPR